MTVERLRRISTTMARPKHGDPLGFLLHSEQCHMPGDLHTGLGWTGRLLSLHLVPLAEYIPRMLNKP